MITSTKSLEIIMCLDSSSVIQLRIPHGSSILCDPPIHNIIPDIPAHKEPLVRNDRISRKRGSLEQIQKGTGMQRGLSIVDPDFGVLGRYAGEKGCADFEFDAPCDLIVEFDFGVKGVEGGPSLSQGDAAVSILSLEFARDAACDDISIWQGRGVWGWGHRGQTNFGVLGAFDGELDAVGGFSFYFEFCAYARGQG